MRRSVTRCATSQAAAEKNSSGNWCFLEGSLLSLLGLSFEDTAMAALVLEAEWGFYLYIQLEGMEKLDSDFFFFISFYFILFCLFGVNIFVVVKEVVKKIGVRYRETEALCFR